MKRFIFSVAVVAALIIAMGGCHSHSHDHVHEDPVPESFSEIRYTENIEFFLDFAPPILGQSTVFAAHFTDLGTYKPVKSGQTTVQIFKNNNEISEITADSAKIPGLWVLEWTPSEIDNFDLQFIFSAADFEDTFLMKNIPVFESDTAALEARSPQPEGDEISFLKEQAWKIDFAVEPIKRNPIHGVIHTSGEIQPVKGEEKILSAKTGGIVLFKSKNLGEGREVKSGEVLFSITSKGMVRADLDKDFQTAKARLDKAKSDFERAENLLKKEIIGHKEYERRKMEFTIAEAEFQTLTTNYQSSQTLRAPMSGIIKNILISDGQFVEEGAPLIEITQNEKLLLHADISQNQLPNLRNIQSANFKTPYQNSVESIEKYNGRLVSYGKMIEDGGFLPLVFELDNIGNLIPGSFVEVFLLTNPTENSLVLPKKAIMEEYGSHYVYIQTGGESFEKREVKLGISDGVNFQILSGISEGVRVVTKGAYQVKMASMSSEVPGHHHH